MFGLHYLTDVLTRIVNGHPNRYIDPAAGEALANVTPAFGDEK